MDDMTGLRTWATRCMWPNFKVWRRLRALSARSGVVHLARVHVRVIVLVVDVVCLMLVLSALVVLLAVLIQFGLPIFCSKRYTLYNVGIVYCKCGHFLQDGTEENKRFVQYTLDLLSIPNYDIRKGRPHGPPLRKERRGSRISHCESAPEEMQEKRILEHSRSVHPWCTIPKDHDRIGSHWRSVIREMEKLANEDHTHHATEKELNVYRGNWWIRSNFVGTDTMPIRHRTDIKEALSTLRRLKNAEDQAYYQNWWQSSSSSWWQWQDSWWHPSSETSPRRWTQHWSIGETW